MAVLARLWAAAGVGDFNGDGTIDVIGFDLAGNAWVGLSQAGPATAVPTNFFRTGPSWGRFPDGFVPEQVNLDDFDGSGETDVARLDSQGRWSVCLSNGTDEFLGDQFWADWEPASAFATLDDDLKIERIIDRLALA